MEIDKIPSNILLYSKNIFLKLEKVKRIKVEALNEKG
jgi:hypothetical protein